MFLDPSLPPLPRAPCFILSRSSSLRVMDWRNCNLTPPWTLFLFFFLAFLGINQVRKEDCWGVWSRRSYLTMFCIFCWVPSVSCYVAFLRRSKCTWYGDQSTASFIHFSYHHIFLKQSLARLNILYVNTKRDMLSWLDTPLRDIMMSSEQQ